MSGGWPASSDRRRPTPGVHGRDGASLARCVRRDARCHQGHALHRTRRWERARPDGDVRPLGRSVAPNQEVEIALEWTARIPRPFARPGWVGDYYFIAQWFPKLGVLESQGWNTHQFHAATEFYSDFGVYDVRLTCRAASSSAPQA